MPDPIQPLLDAYLTWLEQTLPGFLSGFYLHGSIALGAFSPRLSDIDFVATLSRPASAGDLARLAEIHRAVAARFRPWPLDGCYLRDGDVGKHPATIAPVAAYRARRLLPATYHDINLVTWWVLKNRGIALLGAAPSALAFEVDMERLLAYVRLNLNVYWGRYIRQPFRIASLLTDYSLQWAVLGVLRQWYTLREHAITSKTGAGQYALAHLPSEWHRPVRAALAIRDQTKPQPYPWRVQRAMGAYLFLRYIIRTCNESYVR